MVLQDDVLSALMTGSVLVLIQTLSGWSAFAIDGAGVLSYYLI